MEVKKLVNIQYLAVLCIACLHSTVFSTTNDEDFAVLNEFKKGLNNPELLEWPIDSSDPCGDKWPHVICDGARITQIQAQSLGLGGSLTKDLNKLSMLERISLQRNDFSGQLPSLSGLSSLQYAFLDYNQFDTIPADFFIGLISLQVLSLDDNPLNESAGWMLSSDLSASSQLRNLSVVNCNLAESLPDFLGNMTSLSVLKMSYNRLSGEIPRSFGNLNLQILWLNNQQGSGLGGSVDVITSMMMLSQVWLHGNQFTGPIPSSVGALTSLTTLWLNDNNLVGLIPENLTSLPGLRSLQLDNNYFMGPIPKVGFSNFTYKGNKFCQDTPGVPCSPEVTALLEFLDGVNYPNTLVDSWSNNDPCSPWLGVACNEGKVTHINLPNYHLNGTISPSLSNLDSLVNVILANNNLNGTIPTSLTGLKSLKLLDLSSNNISPPVPSFPTGVTLKLDGNKLLSNSNSPGSSPDGDTSTDDSPFSSNGTSIKSANSSKKVSVLIIIITVVVGITVVVLVFLFLYFHQKRKSSAFVPSSSIVVHPRSSSDPDSLVKVAVASNAQRSVNGSECYSAMSSGSNAHVIRTDNFVISIQVLRKATQNFAPENVLGRGGFGVVYKGELHDGMLIAVKRMESAVLSCKGLNEFHAEIDILSKVRHRNLVSILGYCVEENERLLVYEYMPRGALSKHLFHWKQHKLEPLSWKKRLNIALDVARGMEYLHNLAQHCFIHRDLKSSNILLADDYKAKVSDFGLVKLAPDAKNSVATRLAGTFGYLAPEYAVTGKVTTKVDVFSFGVVLMELITGLMALDEDRPEESRYLVSWFCAMNANMEKFRSIIDPSIAVTDETFESITVVAGLAGHCAAREPHQRPDMGHAVNVLSPLVDKWKPISDDQDEYLGIDFGQPLLQMVKGWQEADGGSVASSMSLDYSKGSIPARPAGFAESFTSADGR